MSKDRILKMYIISLLTTHMGAGRELGCHLGIHGYHDLLLLCHERVSVLDLLLDPHLEDLPEDGRAHVHNPLFGHFWYNGLIGEV